MRLRISSLVIMIMAITCAAGATTISYQLNDLGSGSYKYEYYIDNPNDAAINQFTIWFDESLYGNLEIISQSPVPDVWDETILLSTGLGVPLGYDALAFDTGVPAHRGWGGFTVKFDWLGDDMPGSQFYEIIDPTTSQTIASGYTVPEPITLLFLGFGGLVIKRRSLKN